MKFININSNIVITPAQRSFIEEVLLCDDRHDIMQADSFYQLSKTIPVFLINEESMKKHDFEIEGQYEPNSDFRPDTEWLGFYGRDSSGLFEHTPRIAICPERIAKCVSNDEEFMFLLAKVIVHEFSHAKMDYEDQNIKYRKKDTFWRWMEESSANRYTLEVFENYTRQDTSSTPFKNTRWKQSSFDFVVDFIKKQSPAYALGYELFDKRPVLDWEWEREKDSLGGQKRAKEKEDWLEYMQANYKNINEKKSHYLYDCVFNGATKAKSTLAKKKLEEKIADNDPNITQKDLENVTDMGSLFHGITELKADISGWDVSKVINMGHMFKFSTFNPNISKWNVSNVTDMRLMFCDAEFDGDLSEWNISKVENMSWFMKDVDSTTDFKNKYQKK